MKIIRIQNSVLNSNSFILSDETYPYCWLVDVGDIEPIWKAIGNRQMKGVFLTHTHYDHIYGINKLVEYFPECVVYTSLHGKDGLFSDKLNLSRYHEDSFQFQGTNIEVLQDGDEIQLYPNVVMKAMYTPGHDWSCMSYYTDKLIFTGDSYIPNVKVVTSFPKSNKSEAKISLGRLLELCKNRDIYPGHNEMVKCVKY